MTPEPPQLETARLLLAIPGRIAGAAQAAYLRENARHLEAWSPALRSKDFDPQATARALGTDVERALAGSDYRFCIFDRRLGVESPILGHVNFTNIIRGVFLACTLGYDLAENAIAFVFEQLQLHRIMANYMPANVRSAAVLRRLGFTIEGTAKAYLFLAGAWQDHVLTSLVNPGAVVPSG